MRARGAAFTLVEVVVALTLVLAAASALHEGLGICTAAGRRQAFFERCTRFLQQDFERLLAEIASANEPRDGELPGPGPRIAFRIEARPEAGMRSLTRVTVRFTPPEGTAGQRPYEFQTFHTSLLKAPQPAESTKAGRR